MPSLIGLFAVDEPGQSFGCVTLGQIAEGREHRLDPRPIPRRGPNRVREVLKDQDRQVVVDPGDNFRDEQFIPKGLVHLVLSAEPSGGHLVDSPLGEG